MLSQFDPFLLHARDLLANSLQNYINLCFPLYDFQKVLEKVKLSHLFYEVKQYMEEEILPSYAAATTTSTSVTPSSQHQQAIKDALLKVLKQITVVTVKKVSYTKFYLLIRTVMRKYSNWFFLQRSAFMGAVPFLRQP